MRKTLDRVLSRSGVASRQEARELITTGRVTVDGRRVADPQAWIELGAEILVDGLVMSAPSRVYIALHKPAAYLTTRRDPQGRPTVFDLLDDNSLVAVGRLDRETSGLLLLTNDTDFAEAVTNPASRVVKTYVMKVSRFITDEEISRLREGVRLRDGPTRPAVVRRLRNPGGKTVLEMTISEGRNRQVRRMIEAIGAKVISLARVAVGPVALGDLPAGQWRALEPDEVVALLDSAEPSRRLRTGRDPGQRRGRSGERRAR